MTQAMEEVNHQIIFPAKESTKHTHGEFTVRSFDVTHVTNKNSELKDPYSKTRSPPVEIPP